MIRELPPLRLTIEAATPSGKRYRWAADAFDARDKPFGLRFSSTMPGGYENLDVTLARESDLEAPDLERLTTLTVRGAGGDIAGEYRLERAPRVSGDQMAVTPSAVGWQAALSDNKSAQLLGIDRDLGRWTEPARERMAASIVANYAPAGGPSVAPSPAGTPGLSLSVDGEIGGPTGGQSEAMYDAGSGNLVGAVRFAGTPTGVTSQSAWLTQMWSSPDTTTLSTVSTDTDGAAAALATHTLSTPRRYLHYLFRFTGTSATNATRNYALTGVAVIGDHGITVQGTTSGTEGLAASDIIAYVVSHFAGTLTFTEGINGTIAPSSYVIPQFAYLDATTAAELVRQATRFGLEDWAVWDQKTFYWHPRDARGRNWRARSGPTRLEETGPQVDRIWESVIVQYRDVDGSTRTVGPPGSGAGTEDSALKDDDPENPANKLGITRRDLLQAGTLTAAGAIELGRRFLEQTKLLDSSGRATITGHVLDDHGILHPYWRMKAGDRIAFIDAAETGYRRITRASHDAQAHTCSIDLDAPPDALDALLERLGVSLVPLGIN